MTGIFDFDAVVVGAGVVGLATGRALAIRGLSVLLLERQASFGQGVSSRSSEVIHAGLYYPTGSLRARLCVAGRRALYVYASERHVAHEKIGKLIVAVDQTETPRLEALARQARANGVEGVRWLPGEEARAMEPELRAVAALHSSETGIIDSHGLMLALLGDLEAAGGVLARRAPFESARPLAGGGFAIVAGGAHPAELTARRLVLAAGLGAQRAASSVKGYPGERIPPARLAKGVYFRLAGPPPFDRLVYPLPVAGALGTHFTRDLAGQGRFGPDIEFVASEDYRIDAGRAERFAADIRRYWPGVPDGALSPDYAAMRPKIHGPDEPQADFRVDGEAAHGIADLVALFGIESPGLTACLAIGDRVAAMLGCGKLVRSRAGGAQAAVA